MESRRPDRRCAAELFDQRGSSAALARHRLRHDGGAGIGTAHTLIPADGAYADYLFRKHWRRRASRPTMFRPPYFPGLAHAIASQRRPGRLVRRRCRQPFRRRLRRAIHEPSAGGRCRRQRVEKRGRGSIVAHSVLERMAGALRLASRLNDFTALDHPVNQAASFADWDAVRTCFGETAVAEAAAQRRTLLDRLAVPTSPQDRLHGAGFLGEAVDSASLWTTLFNHAGADLLCPFLDSRMLRFALNLPPAVHCPFRRPQGTTQAGTGVRGTSRGGAAAQTRFRPADL